MSFLRGFFSVVLGFLLVLSLVVIGIIITINLTVLNPDFVVSKLDKFDIYSIIIDEAKEQLPDEEPFGIMDDILVDLKPWLEEQVETVVYAGYSYLKENQELNVVISLEPVKSSIKQSLRESIFDYLPPGLENAPESLIEAYLSQVYAGIDVLIPQQFEISETSLEPEIMANLEQARQIVSYVKIAYIVAVSLAVLLVIFIALTHWWRTKPIARTIGIAFATAGIASAIITVVSRPYLANISRFSGEFDIPPEFQLILPQLVTDITAPLLTYGIGFLIAGTGLIILSVLLKSSSEPGNIS